MSRYRILFLLPFLFLVASCSSMHRPAYRAGSVVHVVICWMKDRNDAAARQQLLSAADALRQIPGVSSVTAGKMLPSNRPIVDSSYDVAFVIAFPSAEAMNKYVEQPEHVRLKQEVLDRYVAKYLVYDFVAERQAESMNDKR